MIDKKPVFSTSLRTPPMEVTPMKTTNPSLKFLQPAVAGALAMVIAWGLSARSAQADPYVVTLQQVGSNVVATGSGAIDLTGLTFDSTSGTVAGIFPSMGFISVGPTSFPSTDHYSGTITGPTSFGIGAFENASNGSGDLVGIFGGGPTLTVPQGYVSGSPLSDSATYAGTFGSIGVTPGTYVWTWGTGQDQKFTLDVVVPEGSTLSLLFLGMIALFGASRFRSFHLA
jgi:hypothetical protein